MKNSSAQNIQKYTQIFFGFAFVAVGMFFFLRNSPKDSTVIPVPVQPAVTGDTADFVSFSVPPGQKVSGKIAATGSIQNSYFFEATLVVKILDANKNVLKEDFGTATTDWTNAGPVSFATSLDFSGISPGNGFIRLENDNPSGNPANDKYVDIPVVF